MMAVARRMLLIAVIGVANAMLPSAAMAQASTPDGAAQFLDTLGRQALTVLQAQEASLEQREAQVRQLLSQNIDLALIGRFVLGRAWNQATPDQRAEYQRLFREWMLRTYSRRIGGYAGEQFTVVESRPLSAADVLVTTEILRPSGPPLLAGWRVRGQGGSFKIIDVMVSGVSMAQTQRSEFAAVVRRQGVEGLIESLRARVEKFTARPS